MVHVSSIVFLPFECIAVEAVSCVDVPNAVGNLRTLTTSSLEEPVDYHSWIRSGQLIMQDKQRQRVRFRVILAFCFHLSSSCDTGESGMDFAPLSFLGS